MRRRWGDAVVVVVSAAVLIWTMALSARETVPTLEERVFRWINDLPGAIYPVIWPLMQYGTFITIPLLSVVAAAIRRFRLAGVMLISGVGVYFLAKVIKAEVYRLRPGALLSGVHLRGIGTLGLGYPSGHAAVSAALAVAASAYLSKRWQRISIALAVIVSFGRTYVGAHLPLDVVGGAALGAGIAAAIHLVIGVPVRRPVGAERTATD